MTDKVFEYGGKHFIPERQLKGKENEFTEIAKKLRIDTELGFCKKGYAYESKFDYSYGRFYTAATDQDCDLFRCVENGKLYIPCQNDLQEYVMEKEREKTNLTESNNMDNQMDDIPEFFNYAGAVAESVEQEFNNFCVEQKQKSKDEILSSYLKIYAYSELHRYLTSKGTMLDYEDYQALHEDKGSILACLYDEYFKQEYAHLTTDEDILEFVTGYNRKYHKNIFQGEAEFE